VQARWQLQGWRLGEQLAQVFVVLISESFVTLKLAQIVDHLALLVLTSLVRAWNNYRGLYERDRSRPQT
jgi:hypothetical protein